MNKRSSFWPRAHGRRRRSFIEQLLLGLSQTLGYAQEADLSGGLSGFLQGLDPRVKLVACSALLLSVLLAHSLLPLLALLLLALGLAMASKIPVGSLCPLWLSVLLFTGTVALPAIVLVPGSVLWTIPYLHWGVTEQGASSAALLILRSEVSVTLAGLLILSTPWPHLLKALRCLGVPVVLVAMLGMTHRYIFVLLDQAVQMFEARRSRVVAVMCGAQKRRLVAASAGMLLGKALLLSSEVHLAMISRGYRGEIRLLHDFRTRRRDWVSLAVALIIPWLMVWGQR